MSVERPNPGYLMDNGQDKTSRKAWIRISPWVIMGSLIVMVPIFIFTTLESIRTQRRNMELMLSEKGAALIRSFEAGTRTGMMGMDWSGARVQRLIMETAELPDIVYIMITDKDGRIVAHNQPMNIGRVYGVDDTRKRIGKTLQWRVIKGDNGKPVFELYRRFYPSRGGLLMHRPMRPNQDWFYPHMIPQIANPPVQTIYLGLDMEPVEQIIHESIKQKIILAIILLMYGLLGIVAVVISQNYLSTRRSLSRIKAFSDTLVENMPIGLIVIGEDGTVITLNDVSERLLKITASEVAGRKSEKVLPGPIISLINEIRQTHNISVRDLRIPIDEKTMAFEASASILRDDENKLVGHIVLLRDITEVEHLKREVERRERLASIGSLAAGVAHEIRNPLSSIKGFATYFKERYREVPEDQRIADIMVGEVERLNRVISQLLEFARPMDLRKKPSSLSEILSRSLEMIEKQAGKKDVVIDRSGLMDGPCTAEVDPDKIGQVLLNLYLNAMDAMEGGGTLSVGIRCDEKTSRLIISVSDTGRGIAEEDLPHIFDPYFTTKQSGTGLGLAIVHKIMEAHGGEIKVESTAGHGTTVSVIMPSGGE
ncbi:MAG TPA: ATP-binding protein [Deltaproteobacteria bacterium]|nr:ATP-binding protein [Deltaproteobacteria bacterium]